VINQHFNGAATVARLVWDANGPGLPALAGGAHYTDYDGYLSFVVGCKPRAGISLKTRSWTGSMGADDWTFYVFGYNGNGRILRAM
jgi:hypothetical protein